MNSPDTKPRTILLVEDDDAICEMYKMKFERSGFTVIVAKNGQEGFDLAKEHMPDLILLDLMMPEVDGPTMLKNMRDEEWGEKLKVVILTNISRDEAPMELMNLKIEDYIVKALMTPQQVIDKATLILG